MIEVDITRSSQMKQGIYAALRVPEVWPFDGDTLRVLLWQDNEYVETGEGRVLPGFPMEAARRLLAQRHVVGETTLVRQFQHMVQGNL